MFVTPTVLLLGSSKSSYRKSPLKQKSSYSGTPTKSKQARQSENLKAIATQDTPATTSAAPDDARVNLDYSRSDSELSSPFNSPRPANGSNVPRVLLNVSPQSPLSPPLTLFHPERMGQPAAGEKGKAISRSPAMGPSPKAIRELSKTINTNSPGADNLNRFDVSPRGKITDRHLGAPRAANSPRAVQRKSSSPRSDLTPEKQELILVSEGCVVGDEATNRRFYEQQLQDARNREILHQIIGHVGESLGSGLLQVGTAVGHSAVDAALTVGTLLGQRAERVLIHTSEALPKYSSMEMKQVIARKNDLLAELSHCCLLLGESKDRERQLLEQSEAVRRREEELIQQRKQKASEVEMWREKVFALESQVDLLSGEKEKLEMWLMTAEAEVSVHKTDFEAEARLTRSLKAELAELAEQNSKLNSEVVAVQDAYENSRKEFMKLQSLLQKERTEHDDDHAAWEEASQAMSKEQQKLREECQEAFDRAASELRMTQIARDKAEAELEVLRDLMAADKLKAESESARQRENIATQQTRHSEQLAEKDAVLHGISHEVSILKEQLESSRREKEEQATQLNDLKETHNNLLQQHQDLNSSADNVDKRRTQEIAELKASLKTMSKQLQDEQTKNKKFQQIHEQLGRCNEALEIKHNKLNAANSSTKVEVEQLREALKQSKEELQEKESGLISDKSVLEEELASARSQLHQKSMELLSVSARCQSTESCVNDMKLSHETTLQQLTQQLNVAQKRLNDLESSCAHKDSLLVQQKAMADDADKKAKTHIKDVLAEKETVFLQLSVCREELAALKKEKEAIAKDYKLRLERKEKEFFDALNLAEDTQGSLRSELHLQLLQCRQDLETKDMTIAKLTTELNESKVTLAQQETAAQQQKSSLRDSHDRIACLQNALTEKSIELQQQIELSAKLATQQKDYSATEESMKSILKGKDEQIAQQLSELHQLRQELQVEIEKYRSSCKELDTLQRSNIKEKQALETDVRRLKVEFHLANFSVD